MKKVKRRKFPFMILIIAFLIEVAAVSACLAVYFIRSGKIMAADAERNTKNYSAALAEALSEGIGKVYKGNKTPSLQNLFYNRINKDIIDEAFFVLNNGKILLHSRKAYPENLGGNISNGEFAYNIEMILYPSMKNTKEILFSNYNLIDTENPPNFDPRVKKLLKQYICPDTDSTGCLIDSTGWLTSKAVFYKNKPIGTISFIISKQKIFDALTGLFEDTIKYWKYGIAGSAVFSLLIALLAAFSMKGYAKTVHAREGAKDAAGKRIAESIEDDDFAFKIEPYISQEDETPEKELEDEFITIDISKDIPNNAKDADTLELDEDDIWELDEIQDAIPIRKNTPW